MPKPIQPKRTNIQAPRRSPGPRRSRRTPPVGLGACWRSWAAAVSVKLGSSLLCLGRLGEERHECVELCLRQELPEVLRHYALRIAGLDVRLRIHDRLVDEPLERLFRLLRVRDELVEVRADRASR